MILRVAARKSDLARLQAYEVGRAIERAHSNVRVEYQFSTSLGDANLNDPLWKMPEKGVFTADLTEKLIQGECDLVVHSWKDLPTEPHPLTEIAATLKRADVRDVLLLKRNLSSPLKIYSSSPRREYNGRAFLRWALPAELAAREFEFSSVRGNIATRARKYIENPDVAGWIVAKAALDRLLSPQANDLARAADEFAGSRAILRQALSISRFQVLPVSQSPAAPAQGALAIEVARERDDIKKLLQEINDPVTWSDVTAERKEFQQYGGGCHQKIGITYETRPFGQIQCGRGEKLNKSFSFTHLKGINKPPKTTKDHVFPLERKDYFFERRPLALDHTQLSAQLKACDLFVARTEAWPIAWPTAWPFEKHNNGDEDGTDHDTTIVWASGIQTWQKLARLGVWVSGCQDSRGESEPIVVDHLLGREPQFTKLTHREATMLLANETSGTVMPVVATYELVDKLETQWPDLSNKTHFFWSSFSQFERMSRQYRDVLMRGYHSCGPGNTYRLLQNVTSQVSVYLSHESWLEDILK